MLMAPEWSEYISHRQVRHLWMCTACGYDFETLVVFPAETATQHDDEAA
jgi:ribosomal protein L37AE/L43A